LHGGPILTMDNRNSRAAALAIRGKRILGVGSLEEVKALNGGSARMIDLAGRTLPFAASAVLSVAERKCLRRDIQHLGRMHGYRRNQHRGSHIGGRETRGE